MKKNTSPSMIHHSHKVVVILAAIILVLVAILLFTSRPTQQSSTNQSVTQTIDLNDFDKVEDTSYTFYYPKGYAKVTGDEGDVLAYENSGTKAYEPEIIYLRIQPNVAEVTDPTYESCLKFSESFRRTAEDEITAEVAIGGLAEGKGVGCKVIAKSTIPDVNDSTVTVEKTLWNNEGDDSVVYRVRAIHYGSASNDVAKALDLAVDQFSLK